MLPALILSLSALCGVAFGYAAQRGSLCVISGIEAIIEGRSPRVFLAFLRCSLWVLVLTLPIAWAIDGTQFASIAWPTFASMAGGLMFGAGAAINGGCSFGTIIRLGSGDLSFLGTLSGLAIGVLFQTRLPSLQASTSTIGPSPLEAPTAISVIILTGAMALCIGGWLARRLRGERWRDWSPEQAALVMGAAGGVLYALHGSWAYTIAIERALSTMRSGGIPDFELALIFFASLLGAGIAACGAGQYRLRLNLREVPGRLLGGTIMGMAAALVPGGNDALILHAIPALSPHAPFGYIAMVAGAASMLALSAHLRRKANA